MKKATAIFTIMLIVAGLLSTTAFGQHIKSYKTKQNNKKVTTSFDRVRAYTDGRGVYLDWQMRVESGNLGFHVYRMSGSEKIRVNPHLIGGGFLRDNTENLRGLSYSHFDPSGHFGTAYFVETVNIDGRNTFSGYVFPEFVRDLTPIAGISSEKMFKAAARMDHLIEREAPILPKQLLSEIRQNALPPDPLKQKYIAAQPGVKIGVNREGVYRVSRSALETAGFDLSGSSTNWQLFADGIEQAIIVGDGDAYIEFYGTGVDTNETDTQIYYLINGLTPGKRIGTSVRRRIAGIVAAESYRTAALKDDRVLYIGTLRNGAKSNFFSDKIINSTGVSVDFDVDEIDFGSESSTLVVTAQGLTYLPHVIQVSLNGEYLGDITGNNHQSMTRSFQIPTAKLLEGTNSLFLKTPDGATAVSLLDEIQVGYKRRFKSRQNALSFYTIPSRAATVTGFTTSNIRVFDITYPHTPTLVRNLNIVEDNGEFGVYLPANRSKRFYAVEDSAVLTPVSIGLNKGSDLSTPAHNAEFLAITYKDWKTQATDWANYRIGQGITAEVVDVEDIFDEFSFGRISADAIRDFLQFAKTNWQTPPDYVLLFGDTTYDPRDYENRGSPNYIPAKMVDTLYDETGSDEALADFDLDGLAELSIGRIPNRDAATVTLVLNKVMNFEQSVSNGIDRGVLFASDKPDGYDFVGLSQRLANELPAGTDYVMINRNDPDSRTNLLNQINGGKFLVNYSGHGSTGLWASTSFYSILDVPNISNSPNYSIFTMLTCLNGYFLRTTANSLSEALLHSPNGGGVVVWSSTGKTTPDVQEVMARKFIQNFSDPNIERLGDSINIAKQNVVGGRDVRLSWALLGDPMLKIR